MDNVSNFNGIILYIMGFIIVDIGVVLDVLSLFIEWIINSCSDNDNLKD
jgi:hypothetical protein